MKTIFIVVFTCFVYAFAGLVTGAPTSSANGKLKLKKTFHLFYFIFLKISMFYLKALVIKTFTNKFKKVEVFLTLFN